MLACQIHVRMSNTCWHAKYMLACLIHVGMSNTCWHVKYMLECQIHVGMFACPTNVRLSMSNKFKCTCLHVHGTTHVHYSKYMSSCKKKVHAVHVHMQNTCVLAKYM